MKSIHRFLIVAIAGLMMSSCISNKRIVYVQDHDQKKPWNYLADTVFDAKTLDYKLRAGDILYVKSAHRILSETSTRVEESYSGSGQVIQQLPVLEGYTVDQGGRIDLPILGKVDVAGKTIFEAEDLVQDVANKVYPGAAVKLFLLNYYVTVLGEVNRPGRYPVFTHRINVFDAMGMAGDATDFASRETVKILRTRNGQNHLYSVDLTNQDLLADEHFYLQPNDVLMVKPQKRKKYATRDIQNVFSAVTTIVSVVTLYVLITNQ